MPGRTFLDKTFRDPVNRYKKQDDPEERIPGFNIDYPVEGEIGYENSRNQVKQYAVKDILLLELELYLFFNKVFDF